MCDDCQLTDLAIPLDHLKTFSKTKLEFISHCFNLILFQRQLKLLHRELIFGNNGQQHLILMVQRWVSVNSSVKSTKVPDNKLD